MPAVAGERLRTGVNEPKTEPRALPGDAADRPTHLPAVPDDCRLIWILGWAVIVILHPGRSGSGSSPAIEVILSEIQFGE